MVYLHVNPPAFYQLAHIGLCIVNKYKMRNNTVALTHATDYGIKTPKISSNNSTFTAT